MGAGKMAKSGVNNTLLKQRNRGLILKLIATGQCSSRIELSQKTGLAKMTVTYIVNEFLERGIFEERQKVQVEGKGRNPVQLCISDKAPKLIGVHLYREICSVILCDIQLKLLKKICFPVTEETAPQLMEHIFHALDQIMKHWEMRRYTGLESAQSGRWIRIGVRSWHRRIFMGCMTWKLPGK